MTPASSPEALEPTARPTASGTNKKEQSMASAVHHDKPTSQAEGSMLVSTPAKPTVSAPVKGSSMLGIGSRLLFGAILLGSIALIVSANFRRDAGSFGFKWDIAREVPTDVRLDAAQPSKIIHTVSAPGDIEADIEVELSSKVMGKITKLPVREGDRVKKGQLVCTLESVNFESAVRSAEAAVQRARSSIESTNADRDKIERDLSREKKLVESGTVSRVSVKDILTTLLKSDHMLAMNRADLRNSEAALDKAKQDLSDTNIFSPIDGVVSQLDAEVGETVVIGTMNQPGTKIMAVSDMNTIVVRARVDETDVPLVKPGQRATIHVQYSEDLTLTGKVVRISPKGVKGSKGSAGGLSGAVSANPNDVAVFETIISIDNPPKSLQLGMTANVDIQVDERPNVLTVASTAVLHRRLRDLPRHLVDHIEKTQPNRPGQNNTAQRYHQVVFVDRGGRTECRLVKTGVSDETRVEILEGVREGEKVISGPYRIFDKLKDGKAIREMTDEESSLQ